MRCGARARSHIDGDDGVAATVGVLVVIGKHWACSRSVSLS